MLCSWARRHFSDWGRGYYTRRLPLVASVFPQKGATVDVYQCFSGEAVFGRFEVYTARVWQQLLMCAVLSIPTESEGESTCGASSARATLRAGCLRVEVYISATLISRTLTAEPSPQGNSQHWQTAIGSSARAKMRSPYGVP